MGLISLFLQVQHRPGAVYVDSCTSCVILFNVPNGGTAGIGGVRLAELKD